MITLTERHEKKIANRGMMINRMINHEKNMSKKEMSMNKKKIRGKHSE